MSWYKTGTVAINNAGTTVTGTGTAWVDNVDVGEGIRLPDGRTYEITGVVSNTSLTIGEPYLGTNTSGQPYAIQPFRGRTAGLTARASELLDSFQTVRDGIGAGLFPDGSATVPAFRFTADQDTGIYRLGANRLAIATAGVARARFFDDGSIAFGGATPQGDITVGTTLTTETTKSIHIGYSEVPFYGFRILNTNNPSETAAGRFRIQRGTGTAWADAITVSNLGFLGVGLAAPEAPLHVFGSAGVFRLSTSGERGTGALFQSFHDAAGRKGYLGYGASDDTFFVANETNAPIQFLTNSVSRFSITNSAVTPGADATYNLGATSLRWATVFAATGTINTSDEREKTWRGALTADELRAAKRIIAELGVYQWNDAIAEKGAGNARLHFGVRAQQAFAIMEDEGLDWTRYAWCCHDEWGEQTEPELDEDGEPTGETIVTVEAGDRYGIRPDQLAFWLIAAQAAMQADLEARLAALEAA